MPTYLCHGFRWHRRTIRVFVIRNDLGDAAPDWIVGATTASAILDQLAFNYDFLPQLASPESTGASEAQPEPPKPAVHYEEDFSVPPSRVPASEDAVLAYEWSPVKLLEEHDLDETEYPSRPYAWVADYVVRIDLSADVASHMALYDSLSKARDTPWFDQLRDQLEPKESIGWHVVVCGDLERAAPESLADSDVEEHEDESKAEAEHQATIPASTAQQHQSPLTLGSPALPAPSLRAPEPTADIGSAVQGDASTAQPRESGAHPVPLRHKPSKSHGLRRLFGKKDSS